MTEQMKQLLEQESCALAALSDRIDRAVDCIIKTGLASIGKDGAAFVPDEVLTQFSIDPNHDFMVLDAINDRLSERPEVFCFSTDFKKGEGSGYDIEFNPPEVRDVMTQPVVLGPARRAELFGKLLSSLEGLIEDESAYGILHCVMTDEEIRASGFQFENQDEQERTREVLDLLGGPDPQSPDRPIHPCKLRDLIQKPLPDSAYLESDYADLMPIGGLDPADLTPEQLAGWEAVLDADVVRVYPGAYGVHIEMAGVDGALLSDFSFRACLGKLAGGPEPAEESGLTLA